MTDKIENRDGRLNHIAPMFTHMGIDDGISGDQARTDALVRREADDFVRSIYLRPSTAEERSFAVQCYRDGFRAGDDSRSGLAPTEPPGV
jgi:hypothetical protein